MIHIYHCSQNTRRAYFSEEVGTIRTSFMTKQFLYFTDVSASLEQMSCE